MLRNLSKNELFIFIAIIRQHLKVYLHENNQKQIIQNHSKKRKSPVRFCLLIRCTSVKKIIKSYNFVGAGAHKVGKMVAIPIFCECEKDKSYWKRLVLAHLRKYENMYITALPYGANYSRMDKVKFLEDSL